MRITYTEDNTHVEDSYKATNISLEVGYIIRYYKNKLFH